MTPPTHSKTEPGALFAKTQPYAPIWHKSSHNLIGGVMTPPYIPFSKSQFSY